MSKEKPDKQKPAVKRLLPRGSGTFFRVAYETHLNLSRQADHKAHLMLGLNMLVLSVVVAKHHKGVFFQIDRFFYPNLLLVAFSLAVVILAVLASRPILSRYPEGQPPNWLFFASFAAFPYGTYDENIQRLLCDEGALQEAMTRDLLFLGRALAKKYRYLSLCYRIFGYGLFAVAGAYVLAWVR